MSVSRSTIAAIRFGYGFHARQAPPDGAETLRRQLRQGARAALIAPVTGSEGRRAALEKLIEARREMKRTDGDREPVRMQVREMRQGALMEVGKRIYQRALSPHGFYERLAAFWTDHFSVSWRNPGQMYMMPVYEIEAIRPHVMGRFEDMLGAVIQHPVMLHYLDQVESFGPKSRAGKRRGKGLNENLAREVLELHTLGVGGPYTQTDVRELAELLTGYGVRRGYKEFRYFPQRAEPGAEMVLGRRYGGDPGRAEHALEAMRALARHPVTAHHLAKKLVVHFVSDTPDPDLVSHIAGAWRRTGGSLPEIYDALLEHPAAWRDFGSKVKRPVDLVISTLRAIGVDRRQSSRMKLKDARRMFGTLKSMGQPMFQAPGPDGWAEEATAWITPQGLASRLNFASAVGRLVARRADVDPRRFAEVALRDALRPDTRFAVGAAPDRWEGFAFALASPEFNRR